MEGRFCFRTPIYGADGKFKKLVYWRAVYGAPAITCREGDVFKAPEQCTGLRDKNGRLIYEGDILKIVLHSKQYKPFTLQEAAVIVFKEGAFGHDEHGMYMPLSNYWRSEEQPSTTFETLGNIHENPELLEGQK